MWPGSSSVMRSSSIGSRFFLPCFITCMYVGFAIYMLVGIKIYDLYTSIKPSHLRVFNLANVRNDGYCQRSAYDLLNYFLGAAILFSYELQLLRGSSANLAVPDSNSYQS